MNKYKAPIIVIAAVILSFSVFALTAGKNLYAQRAFQKKLNLGGQYLSQMEYEQAIVYFTDVLAADPQNLDALLNTSKAYAGMAEISKEEFEEKIKIYENAIAFARDSCAYYPEDMLVQEALLNAYEAAGDFCLASQRFDEALRYYEKACEDTAGSNLDERRKTIRGKIDRIKEEQRKAQKQKAYIKILQEIYTSYQKDDFASIVEAMRSEKYIELSHIEELPYFYVNEDGKGAAVYQDGYCYCGEFINNRREGNGSWIFVNADDDILAIDRYRYQGEWKNDKPDGKGIVEAQFKPESEKEEGSEYSISNYAEVEVSEGYYHGKIHEAWNVDSGKTHIWNWTARNGIPDIIEHTSEGGSIIAYDENDKTIGLLWFESDGKAGIRGFF